MDVWFADPHTHGLYGSNENSSGLLRRFLPKGVDLSVAGQEYLNHLLRLQVEIAHPNEGGESDTVARGAAVSNT